MKLEETLNGGYSGLYGEVVTEDCYRLKELDFIPQIFFDFGANIGVTTRFARVLFPDCLIIAVEPHKPNIDILIEFTYPDEKITLFENAIGMGEVWRTVGAKNGAGENYITDSVGYPTNKILLDDRMKSTTIVSIMPDEIINRYLKKGVKSVLKLDIEAGENVIWQHKSSMDALKKIDYLCFEVHRFGLNGSTWQSVQDETEIALKSFGETHTCITEGVHFYATKKKQ